MKSRVVEIVDIVALKFASDEAARWKVGILEPLFYSQYELAMPNLSVETSLPEVNLENLHYCRFIRIALIIKVQDQERSMCLISNMRFLASCAY